jgi:hypothetical protein
VWRRAPELLAALALAAVLVVIAAPELVPRRRPAPAPSAVRPDPLRLGFVHLQLPAEVPRELVRVSLLRGGEYARSTDGEALTQITPERLAQKALEPGHYVAVVRYRGTPLEGVVAAVEESRQTAVQPPLRELAAVEYQAGLAGAAAGADVARFRRTLALDPQHVNAHLQLAAYALLTGRTSETRRHLRRVRAVEPDNPHAARLERLLRRKEAAR